MAAGARTSVTDVAPGLWLWRLAYPDWKPGVGWEEHISSTCVESGGEVALLDPLALPALRAMLELPFERVIVSHGAPVHDRAEFERALERPPWTGEL